MRRARRVRAALVTGLFAVALLASTLMLQPGWYVRFFHPLKYPNFIRAHAANYDLPPELVAAVIEQESGFDERARSGAGAVGLMQVTPRTAQGIADRTGGKRFHTRDLLNPELNIRYGCWYLRHLRSKYDESGNDTDLALAAYNAGQGKVDGWIAADEDGTLEVTEIPFAETRHYVRQVRELSTLYRRAYPELHEPVAGG